MEKLHKEQEFEDDLDGKHPVTASKNRNRHVWEVTISLVNKFNVGIKVFIIFALEIL